MKIGLNADLLERLGKVKLIKDKNGTVKNAIFSDELVNYIKAKRDQNHETYIFFSNPQEMTLKERAKTKRRIFKKYQLEPKYQPRLVFTTESDYNNAIDRNAISIDSGDVYSSFEELISILEHQKELMEAPILHPSTPSCGVPSKDAFWRKYQTPESYKLAEDFKSPYERIVSGNIDFLDENFIYNSDFGGKMTYKEVFDKADELCRVFMEMGIKKGSKVPLILASTPEMFITILALWKAKATIVPLFPKSTTNEIKTKLESIDYDYMVINDIFYSSTREAIKSDAKAIVLPVTYSANPVIRHFFNQFMLPKFNSSKIEYNDQFIKYDDLFKKYPRYTGEIDTSYDANYEAVQLFTGGTVKSKGVILTAQNLDAAFKGYPIAEIPVLRDDKFACFLPINHVFGLVSIIYSASAYGGKLSTMLKINLKKMDKMFVDDKITVFAGIPTMVDAILSNKRLKTSDLSQLRYFILGGAKTDEKTKTNVMEFGHQHGCNLKLVDGLGQTEVSTAYLYNNVLSINDRVKIVNPETNEELAYGEQGEICISGPNVMKGYTSSDDNAAALETDENGVVWFHTGDLGYNDNGKIYYVGRLNRRIKVNGELICVEDLEEVIANCNFIKDCCIVEKSDTQKESVPVAFITLNDGYEYNEELQKAIEEYYSQNIVYYSRPSVTVCLDELPKTTIGKPDFKQLKLLAECMTTSPREIQKVKRLVNK